MPVHQHILNWLYSVLTSEYHDVNRTYNDVAQTLTRYPSLAPRTDVHTFPDGTSALLLHISGTIPVNFRGSTYRFPISVWVPHAYPRQPPLIYVTPTDTMRVRPGQHVDPQGQVYHPYLVGWAEFWDKSTLFDFLAILSDVFAKEPPVVSRQQPQAVQSPQPQSHAPPPVPPLPPQIAAGQATGHAQNRPPPPPPKTNHSENERNTSSPLSPPPTQSSLAQRQPSRYDSAPPLPPQAQSQTASSGPRTQTRSSQQQQHHFGYQHSSPPARLGYSPSVQPSKGMPPPPHQQQQQYSTPEYRPSPPTQTAYRQWDPAQAQVSQQPGQWNPAAQQQSSPPVRVAPPPPPPDLLDEPPTLDLPSQAVAPPPIPPNPEKDALLVQLARTLASLRQQARQQNQSSLTGLQAQRHAMLSVLPTIQSEMSQLTQLSSVLTSNATILRQATVKADAVIEGSRNHPAADIDELLVAPTVVSNQLYALVAEERALGDAIFMLGRAVEKGRISPAVFAKMTRSLAREWYLKKALVRKIGIGMGLAS